jgi:polyhydroxybutyrate depolymerase
MSKKMSRLGAATLVALIIGSVSPTLAENPGQMMRRTIEHDGIEREYFVHVPRSANHNNEPLPLVVGVHGYTSTATGFVSYYDLKRHADENGYLLVVPQGSHFKVEGAKGGSYRITSWNDVAANQAPTPAGPHCTDDRDPYPRPPECTEFNRCAWTSCFDDVGFIEKMLDQVQAEFKTDSRRTYLLGTSNGGMMTLRLGCDLSDRFAAIAPIIGQLAPGYACGPKVDLPMIHLFSGKDDTVRFDGTAGSDGFMYTTARQTAKVWARSMACKSGSEKWENEFSKRAGLECTAYSRCKLDGHQVVSCLDPDGGHEWPEQRVPGASATCVTHEQYESMPDQAHCSKLDGGHRSYGMDLVWNFFTRYRLPE